MEFKLNKIDTDIRQTVNNASKEGKVHAKNQINIDKHKNEQKHKEEQKQEDKQHYNLSRYNRSGKKLTINAVKTESVQVEAFFEGNDEKEKKIASGVFLDVRK